MTQRSIITSGPDKYDFSVAVFERNRHLVSFVIDGQPTGAGINGVERVSGNSNDEWTLTGLIDCGCELVRGSYNPTTGQGWIERTGEFSD
ncbi:MAG: hypothetical protein A2599_00805 [Candidatus Staskawiczbacteria bacterium RIFOXYD1_FULL_39_28]|uniref:Uncharacterized protein n=1 Tax=Candidatus Staskawiczbacteria bacterium RIFOXYC1_FULL_38_18 TaxID=1802229 RepID=A0A1G2JAQ2_9BACT|nr:MAG: hypothetical protein A2401_00540 [Candidatus Staskawiczbacteria bacterium RIFOXYC1_FULL_38_18]OGZ91652.1 MAG: hypothetical protein A2599_00805 [Candidatus Staskawiczbacteria bacterium RIFOXYD1_FULL_39_28]